MKRMIEARKQLMEKRSTKGFTLMEMLIVIAIIAVLVAIAIPVFTTQLNNAKDAADKANARSLYAVCMADYMDDSTSPNSSDHWAPVTYTYNNGVVTATDSTGRNVQSFTFSDRTTNVIVEADDNGVPEVTVTGNGREDIVFGSLSSF